MAEWLKQSVKLVARAGIMLRGPWFDSRLTTNFTFIVEWSARLPSELEFSGLNPFVVWIFLIEIEAAVVTSHPRGTRFKSICIYFKSNLIYKLNHVKTK